MTSDSGLEKYDDLPLWSAPFGLTLLEQVKMRSGINILDIGSGSGFPMLELAGRMGPSCMVYGLDPDDGALRMITAKKTARNILNSKILRGIAEEIPFPDKYFGLIVSNNGLNNVTDQQTVLAECNRVADHGAQLVLTMNLPATMSAFYNVFAEVLDSLGMKEEIEKMNEHINFKRKPVGYLEKIIIAAGFSIRSTQILEFSMRYTDGTAFFNHPFIRKAFMPSWSDIIPSNEQKKVFSTVEGMLNLLANKAGELAMGVPYVCFDCYKS